MPSSHSDYHRHFSRVDPILFEVIQKTGPFRLTLERNRFRMLVRSIISQQLSTSAARTIRLRLEAALKPDGISPQAICRTRPEQLQRCGVSAKKTAYVFDLAAKVADGSINLSSIGRNSDEQIVEQLTKVRGIGRWTAQMFLIFSLGRLDVFPHEDLGVRNAIRDLYGLRELPDKQTTSRYEALWTPFASVGAWYCWRSIDLKRSARQLGSGFPS
jgi:DNA-3-methyladenine glycosylase II